jgi:hypothetical protein
MPVPPRLDIANENSAIVTLADAVEKVRLDRIRSELHRKTRRGSKELNQVVSQIGWVDSQTHWRSRPPFDTPMVSSHRLYECISFRRILLIFGSSRSISRLRACCVIHAVPGLRVQPTYSTLRVAIETKNSTYSRRSQTVSTVEKSQARIARQSAGSARAPRGRSVADPAADAGTSSARQRSADASAATSRH